LIKAIQEIKGVQKVFRVRSRWIGLTKAAYLKIIVESKLSFKESHAIAEEVEILLEEEFDITDCTVHIEPKQKLEGKNEV
jgi:divalent metal cation (Fe/Co/Zn/Cd) transporter